MEGNKATAQALLPTETPPARYTKDTKRLLDNISVRSKPRNPFPAPKPRVPDRNRYGLVIPPDRASYDPKNLTEWQSKQGCYESEHHLYYPKSVFDSESSLAKEFRDNKYNKFSYPNFQHRNLHRRYDPFISRYPRFLIPNEDVMVTFLDEADNLELLGVHIRRLDKLIDEVDDMSTEKAEAYDHSIEIASFVCTKVVESEIIFPSFVEQAISKVQRYIPVNFQDSKV